MVEPAVLYDVKDRIAFITLNLRDYNSHFS
jgi:hypothetical protein